MPADTAAPVNPPAPRILACVFVYNEGEKLQTTLARFPVERDYDVVVMDDGSSDGAPAIIDQFPFVHLRHETNRGVGAAFRTVFAYANAQGYDVFIPMAGNGKMHPADIPRLLKPILEDGFDYVQGSRYMSGGLHEHLPVFRKVTIPILTRLIGVLIGFRGTDLTCGFRAYKLAIIRDPRLDITQSWLDRYEMEYYIHYYAVKFGYRITEAPVAMRYPASKKNYSKIRIFTGWWSMLRPWVYLVLGLRK
jgi:dolichol-phosphate mannosyltransferase